MIHGNSILVSSEETFSSWRGKEHISKEVVDDDDDVDVDGVDGGDDDDDVDDDTSMVDVEVSVEVVIVECPVVPMLDWCWNN